MKRAFPLVVLLAAAACNEDVLIGALPRAELGQSHVDFGAVPVGRTESRTVTVQNSGSGPLQLAEPSVGQQQPAFGAGVPEEPIPPAAQAEIVVEFSPPDIGTFEATVMVPCNDQENPVLMITAVGRGFRQGELEVFPDELDFGRVDAGSSKTAQATVRNAGNGPLLVTSISLAPGSSPDFRILSSTRPGELAPGALVPVRIAYSPGLGSTPPGPSALVVEAADPLNPREEVRLVASLNRAPVADAGPDLEVDPLEQAVLDGSASHDPDGDLPLEFSWTLVRRPEGSAAELLGPKGVQPVLVPDLVGLYEAELWVTDSTGLRSLLPDRVQVTALPAERLLVELVWDSPIADLDLHLLAPGGSLYSSLDCYYDNRRPDWGVQGNAEDDPEFKRDDYAGFGPEVVGFENPSDGTYELWVDYYASHTPSGYEPTTATMRVFVDGALAAEIARRLERQGSRWFVATVKWPEGIVTKRDELHEE